MTTNVAAIPVDPSEFDRFLRHLARLLRPYLADEGLSSKPTVSPSWDADTCASFADRLSADMAKRALALFEALQTSGKVSSVELTLRLELDTPRELAGNLTTSLKRHVKALGLPMPYDGGVGSLPYGGIPNPVKGEDDPQRTYWVDRDGIAARMTRALRQSLAERTQQPSAPLSHGSAGAQ